MTSSEPAASQASLPEERSITISWDKSTTPLEALERTLYALADQLSGSIADSGTSWRLVVYPREPHADDELRHRLRQEVNDQTLRARIAERTDPIRNLVFALAFSRSGLTSDDIGSGAREATGS